MSNADLVIGKRKVLKIEIMGEVHEVTRPTYGMSKQLNKEATEAGDAEAIDVTIKYLTQLGLPEECFKELETEDIVEISQLVFGPKKK